MNPPSSPGHDVFISYAREDSARANFISDQLEALGLSVFFDTEGIDSGEEFPIVIDRAVKGARCVLGLWSRAALEKRWVRIESRIGLDQKKLVAAVIDGMRPEDLPAEFYNVNVDDLSGFSGQPDHPGWQRILRTIGKRVGRRDLAAIGVEGPSAAPQARAVPWQPPGKRPPAWMWIGAGVGALLVALAFVTLRPNRTAQAVPPSQSAGQVEMDEPEPATQTADQMQEMRLWGGCEAGGLSACRAYLARYPQGEFAAQAGVKLADLTRPPAPTAADLSGEWSGQYAGDGNRPTVFVVTISGAPGQFRGRMVEQNTFAADSTPRLYSNIAGETRTDGRVAFVKTYDGTGGVGHSVQYEGRIDESGRAVVGEWRAEGNRGQFRMVRR